jgi:hypothetical protein
MEILGALGDLDEGESVVRLSHADALRATGDEEAAPRGRPSRRRSRG